MKYLFPILFILASCGQDTLAVREVPGPTGKTGSIGQQGLPGTNGTDAKCSVYTIQDEKLWLCTQSGCIKETVPQGVSLSNICLGSLILCDDGSLSLLPVKYE